MGGLLKTLSKAYYVVLTLPRISDFKTLEMVYYAYVHSPIDFKGYGVTFSYINKLTEVP